MNRDRFAARSTLRSATAIILVAIAVCSIAYAGTVLKDRGGYPRTSSTNRPGSDYAHLVMNEPAGDPPFDTRAIDCEKACLGDDKCLSWTYVTPGTTQGPKGNCWLKNKLVAPVKDANCLSGAIGTPGLARVGGEYRHFEHNDDRSPINAHQCYATCASEQRCLAWTYTTALFAGVSAPTCRLNDEAGKVRIVRGAISGWFIRQNL
ncbi:MAG TPA: PAN domain-containing protein [Thermoanaerobaculia bacterium]|nr:PAN domain-containing protein [Thermoanaerobaculia bacterium]